REGGRERRSGNLASVPAPPIPDWDDKQQIVTEVLRLIDESLAHLTSSDPSARQVAAAYLARCCRLLKAMLALREDGLLDVVSLPLRPLFEGWVVALWLLYEQDAALDRLTAD